MLYPLPAVLVTAADSQGRANVFTAAWTGTVCTNPPMVYISVRPERFSHHMILETGEFVLNLTTEKLAYAVDYCGVKSGRDTDKFRKLKLWTEPASEVKAPMIKDAQVCIECRVTEVKHLGSHDLFLAKVLAVHAEEDYLDQKGRLRLQEAGMLVYSHGEYYGLGKKLGTFGYSVRRRKERK